MKISIKSLIYNLPITKNLLSKTYNFKPITFYLLAITFLFTSCYNVERNCKDFKNGKFKSEIEVDGEKLITTFERNDSIQIETFKGVTDTYDVRWTNDCEYIIKNREPKNMAERKALQVKILSTSKESYTFEYNYVGESLKQKGIVYKLND